MNQKANRPTTHEQAVLMNYFKQLLLSCLDSYRGSYWFAV